MNWTEIKIEVPTQYTETAEAIANMAVPYGIYIEDYSDLEKGAMEIAHIDLIDEDLLKSDRTKSIIHVYVSAEHNAAESISYLTERLKSAGVEFIIDSSAISENDWSENWKQYFKCTEIGKRLCICPSWEEYSNTENRVVLNIDPGAAFGTGTHSTTAMCLKLIEEYIKPDCTMLDIGCGSGILSIAGVLLGAKHATGIDIDPMAVKVAKENAKLNNVSDRTSYINGNLNEQVTGRFDIVAANIVADVIINLSKEVASLLNENGIFICSGIIDERAPEVLSALKKSGLKVIKESYDRNWAAFSAIK